MRPTDLYFARGGKGDLYKLPPRKTPPTNDWGDLDGLEVDLSRPLWGSYRMDLSFVTGVEASERFTGDPRSVLSPSVWSQLSGMKPSQVIPYTHRLREVTTFRFHKAGAAELSCSIEIPDPLEVWTRFRVPSLPVSSLGAQRVTLGGTDLGDMGIGVLSYYDSALRPEPWKEGRYLSDSRYRSGRILRPEESPRQRAGVVEVCCVIPYAGDERRVQASLALLSSRITQPGEQLLNSRKGYYSEMVDCRMTRSRFYFTIRFQTI